MLKWKVKNFLLFTRLWSEIYKAAEELADVLILVVYARKQTFLIKFRFQWKQFRKDSKTNLTL
jgi:hypothetical protein